MRAGVWARASAQLSARVAGDNTLHSSLSRDTGERSQSSRSVSVDYSKKYLSLLRDKSRMRHAWDMSLPYLWRRQWNSGCDTRHRQNMETGEWDTMWGIRQSGWRGLPRLHWAGRKTGNICVMVVTNPDKHPKVTQEFVFLRGPLYKFLKSMSFWHFHDSTLDFLFLMQISDLQTMGPVMGSWSCIYAGPQTWEIITCFVFITALAAQTQGLLRSAWLVCLSLSRHSTCERGGRLYIYRESPYHTDIKYFKLTVDSLTISNIMG